MTLLLIFLVFVAIQGVFCDNRDPDLQPWKKCPSGYNENGYEVFSDGTCDFYSDLLDDACCVPLCPGDKYEPKGYKIKEKDDCPRFGHITLAEDFGVYAAVKHPKGYELCCMEKYPECPEGFVPMPARNSNKCPDDVEQIGSYCCFPTLED